MNTQTLTNPLMTCSSLVALPSTDNLPEGPIYASSRDYGFDLDEEEIGREMLVLLPASLVNQPVFEIAPDEFEAIHLWFLS